MTAAALDFALPPGAEATQPPEQRGVNRDEVRLLVGDPGRIRHATFRDLGGYLEPGDLLVVNTSATLPAMVEAVRSDGTPVAVHFAPRPAEDGGAGWAVEVRPAGAAAGPVPDATPGELLDLPGGGRLRLVVPYPDVHDRRPRLWVADVSVAGGVSAMLHRYGRPISYSYVRGQWPLSAYQTVFASDPGSSEMPSAGRPFSTELVVSLLTRGVVVAPITLHTAVSSQEAGEPPLPERYRVPAATAELVTMTSAAGRQVIAVGTTVTRALESVAEPDGSVRPGAGWTDLVLRADRPARVVDGLITGWHAPGASHLSLLEAVVGTELVGEAYAAALAEGYLWHEFGDSCLLRRTRRRSRLRQIHGV